MKKSFFIPILIIIFHTSYSQGFDDVKTDSLISNLNQVELMKQFIGTWKGEFGDNSEFVCENKQFANGIISKSHISKNGEIIESVAQLYGYDKKTDKFIIAELKESSDEIELCSTWFKSTNTGEIIITNPNNAPYRFTFEFKTPDIIDQTAIQADKVIDKIILERVVN